MNVCACVSVCECVCVCTSSLVMNVFLSHLTLIDSDCCVTPAAVKRNHIRALDGNTEPADCACFLLSFLPETWPMQDPDVRELSWHDWTRDWEQERGRKPSGLDPTNDSGVFCLRIIFVTLTGGKICEEPGDLGFSPPRLLFPLSRHPPLQQPRPTVVLFRFPDTITAPCSGSQVRRTIPETTGCKLCRRPDHGSP